MLDNLPSTTSHSRIPWSKGRSESICRAEKFEPPPAFCGEKFPTSSPQLCLFPMRERCRPTNHFNVSSAKVDLPGMRTSSAILRFIRVLRPKPPFPVTFATRLSHDLTCATDT
ncbi:hypothetical protein N7499_001693 [Penicillium canescens]|nr:hypothetical protein N7499_001693 [Penicillium canescens]KAJ6165310.1 hypothetical protein N7485_008554 [Penicillium canescens]